MHSRIYQIGTKPITVADFVTADGLDFEHVGGCIRFADYIEDSSDRDGDVRWLQETAAECGFKACDGGIEWTGDTAFVERWADEICAAAKQRRFDRCEFIAHGDWFSPMHVIFEGSAEITPLWTWAFDHSKEFEVGQRFHIGGIIDYHF